MTHGVLLIVMAAEIVLVGGIMLLSPRIARRGLLFGVYVGEEVWVSDRAAGLVRVYTIAGAAWMVLVLTAGFLIGQLVPVPVVVVAAPLLVVAGFGALYLWAHFRSRPLAAQQDWPPAAAVISPPAPASSALPLVTLLVGLCCGGFAVAFAAVHYADLPANVPTHFGPSGAPDAWRPKSFATVMLPSALTLVMGIGLSGLGFLVARVKPSVRSPETAVSAEAQARFRVAMTRYLSAITITVTAMLTTLSVGAIRVGLGLSSGLPAAMWVLTALLVVLAVGGSICLAVRYGQGGSRLERSVTSAPLTNGLADNRHWVLGSFYVNREDPSMLIEHRFGLGYTLNFGNWKAVALLAAFLGLVVGLVVVALVTH